MPSPTSTAPLAPLSRPRATPAAAAPAPPPAGRRLAVWMLEPTPAEVPRLRTAMRRALRGWGVAPACAETLLLAATELLSNAVRHGGSAECRVRVTLALRSGRLCLDVADGDPSLPCVDPAAAADAGADAEGGRGLLIVGFLVGEAGGRLAAFRVPSGKVVRIRIPAAPAPVGAAAGGRAEGEPAPG
ncbi:ATP-binding protein [Streptomyces sp. NPDC059708]|uniref:ATP-binding protein n=1 Tax=Streptomyces sp. NPDC059708 TaxID=3346916 RepID=UPI0036890478